MRHQMKKAALALAVLAAAANASGADANSDYFTMGVNDTVMVTRSALGGYITVPVKAHFVDPVDHWSFTAAYPEGLTSLRAESGTDMTIPYTGSQGEDCILEVPLGTTEDLSHFSGMTSVYGYFLYSGSYMQYGLVKWEPDEYGDMFGITFSVSSDFGGGTLTMQGTIASGYDHRYWSSGMSTMFYRMVTFAVEYLIGDVNGDGLVNVTDATMLIGLLLNNGTIGVSDLPAADLNGDGLINITDATELINRLLTE